ncbi:MAG: hypothetical protein JSU63_12650 [Phycisphaerales bacterium]|nr:MAG: hypothetical protein JSU63_12650 [Phycisphaerales bacterium]
MKVTEPLGELSIRGISLEARDRHIRYSAPRGTLTPELRRELSRHKPELLSVLRDRRASGRWNPLVPRGWTPEAWHGRLQHMARICMHADRAEELRAWAAAVSDRYSLVRT